ncbi:MAG TPA: hypothetical protein VMG12_23195 [Polyangiaceae bacterium]|nr:hypothetical protein [Polyangiaceae bacterium]
MSVANDSTNARISLMASEACVALWQDYAIELTPAAFGEREASDEPMLFGAIGFVGDGLRATCLLGAHQRLLHVSGRARNQPRDWIAELSNQLVGRIKLRLLGCGVNVRLTTPLALSGIRLKPLPRLAQEPLAFESASGPVIVCLELETEADFVLPAEQPLDVTPGELIF